MRYTPKDLRRFLALAASTTMATYALAAKNLNIKGVYSNAAAQSKRRTI